MYGLAPMGPILTRCDTLLERWQELWVSRALEWSRDFGCQRAEQCECEKRGLSKGRRDQHKCRGSEPQLSSDVSFVVEGAV